MRRLKVLMTVFALLGGLAALSLLDAAIRNRLALPRLAMMAQTARELELTDLALFTEARYTRHPTQADRHRAFQDHPMAFEHFPSGSLIAPPPSLRRAP